MRAEQAVSARSGHKYQSAGRERTGTCRTVISSAAKRSREISPHHAVPFQWPHSIERNAGSFPGMELGEALRNTDTQISNLKPQISTLFYRLTSPVSLSLPPQTSNLPPPRLTSVKKLFIYSLLHSTLYYIVLCDILHTEDGSPKALNHFITILCKGVISMTKNE